MFHCVLIINAKFSLGGYALYGFQIKKNINNRIFWLCLALALGVFVFLSFF